MLNQLNKLSITMMIAYPLVAYFAIWQKQPLLIISYFTLILFLTALKKIYSKHWLGASTILLAIAFIFYLAQHINIEYLVFLPPILIFLSLFLLFFQSLLIGNTPIINLYAKLLGDKLEERHLRYNRTLTIIWSLFFFLMGVTSALLALISSLETWSFFTHVVSYILVSVFFIIEFFYRKRHFAGEIEGGFFQFISKIIKIRPSNLHNKE